MLNHVNKPYHIIPSHIIASHSIAYTTPASAYHYHFSMKGRFRKCLCFFGEIEFRIEIDVNYIGCCTSIHFALIYIYIYIYTISWTWSLLVSLPVADGSGFVHLSDYQIWDCMMSHESAPFDHMSGPQVQGVKSYRTCFHYCWEIRSSSYRNLPVVKSRHALLSCAVCCTQYWPRW